MMRHRPSRLDSSSQASPDRARSDQSGAEDQEQAAPGPEGEGEGRLYIPRKRPLPEMECECIRCGHRWHKRVAHRPARCPRCQSERWDQEWIRTPRRKLGAES